MKLLMSDFDASLVNDSMKELYVCLEGPKDTPYEGGMWKIHVELPDQYPYKSPSIGFETKIFHPNIDEHSGSVCLDVINQTWSPMFTMLHVFETFIPQLLNYPNASDPLNGDASSLYLSNRALYDAKVREYVAKYANKKDVLHRFRQDMGLDSGPESESESESDADADSDSDVELDSDVDGSPVHSGSEHQPPASSAGASALPPSQNAPSSAAPSAPAFTQPSHSTSSSSNPPARPNDQVHSVQLDSESDIEMDL